ncbi:hypothetical protein V202x_15170 [Gimesia aquarii]|uniref:Uncharacterized protein n=1 Tax=Gimesia aquarii TaxID=2527964 RepID=A0A517WSC6_9PLAN|nr:hypothetical protein V202x_15170 [Gimesia aquarii]
MKRPVNPVKVWKWTVWLLLIPNAGLLLSGFLLNDERLLRWASYVFWPFIIIYAVPPVTFTIIVLFEKLKR